MVVAAAKEKDEAVISAQAPLSAPRPGSALPHLSGGFTLVKASFLAARAARALDRAGLSSR